jgi:hypothetical protein
MLGSVAADREEVGSFGVQPGGRLGLAGERQDRPVRHRNVGQPVLAVIEQDVHGQARRVQVVPGQPGEGGLLLGRRLGGERRGTGVHSQQIVEGVAGGLLLPQDVCVQQAFQQVLCRVRRHVGERGSGVRVDVAAWVEAEKPEHAPLGRVELFVGQVERGGDPALGRGQFGEPAALVA